MGTANRCPLTRLACSRSPMGFASAFEEILLEVSMGYGPLGALWATGDKQRQALGAGAHGLLTVPPSEVRVDPEPTSSARFSVSSEPRRPPISAAVPDDSEIARISPPGLAASRSFQLLHRRHGVNSRKFGRDTKTGTGLAPASDRRAS